MKAVRLNLSESQAKGLLRQLRGGVVGIRNSRVTPLAKALQGQVPMVSISLQERFCLLLC